MIVYVLLDAFRGDYINKEHTPFLSSLVSNPDNYFVRYIVPSLSFCERTEIFSGLTPEESYFFTAIGRDIDNSPLKRYGMILKVLHVLEKMLFSHHKLNRYFRYALSVCFKLLDINLKPYYIPLNQISNYRLTEDHADIRVHDFESNIFKYLDDLDLNYYFDTFTSLSDNKSVDDEERIELALKNLDKDIVFLYLGKPDALGHFYGPNSEKFTKKLSELDQTVEELISKINFQTKDQATVIINGDHGMSQVTFTFDAKKYLLNKFKEFSKESYEIFLDSTLLRIWTKDNDLINSIKSDEKLHELGIFIYEDADEKFKKLYGDLVWCINSGGLILPNFFQLNKVNGMHGYIPSESEHYGTLIIHRPKGNYEKANTISLNRINSVLIGEIKSRYQN